MSMGRPWGETGGPLGNCGCGQRVMEETRAEFAAACPRRSRAISCDLRDAAEVDRLVTAVWEEGPLDCLVNNAAGNFLARSETLSPRAVDAVLAIVMHGTAYVTLACGRRWLAEQRRGNVLSDRKRGG